MLGMQTAALLVNDKFLLQFLLLENPHELDSQIALNTSLFFFGVARQCPCVVCW